MTGGLFRLGETLGAGARATVYAGTHARSGRPLAFKVAATPDGNTALLAEYRALRSVRHPNVVGAHALIRLDDGRCALVLDRVFGQSLDRQTFLPENVRVEVALGLTRAVAALHGRGLVHGDIAPANVMVDVQPTSVRTCLIDPGLGREAAGVDGTLGYLAPEVLLGGLRGPEADLYSLGCVLYELIEGTPPYLVDRPTETLTHQHLHAEPTPPSAPSAAVRRLLESLLSKEPEGRPSTAEHVLVELAQAYGRSVEQELSNLGLALLASTPQPALQPAWRPRLLASVDTLMTTGRGAFFVIAGEEGSGRSSVADDLQVAGALRGAWPRRIVDPADGLFAAVTAHTGGGEEDPVLAAVRRLARRPMPAVLIVDAPREDPGVLSRVAEILQTATRTMPLVAAMVVDTHRAPAADGPRFELPPLDPEAAARFVDEWLQPSPDIRRTLVDLFTQAGVRTPAAARLLLREALGRGLLVRRPGAWTIDGPRLAAEAADLIRRTGAWNDAQIRAQPAEHRRVLAAIAVLGRPVARVTLQGLLGLAQVSLDHVLLQLEAQGLVRVTHDGRSMVAHRGLAEAAIDLFGADATAELHRAAARLGDEHLGHELAAAERTWHRAMARVDVPPEEMLAAARTLSHAQHPARALRLLDLLVGSGAPLPPTLVVAAALLRAEALQTQGELEGARAVLEGAVDDAPGDAGLDAALALCHLLVRQGEFREALSRLEGLGDRPQALLDRARALLFTGAYDRADALAQGLIADPNLSSALVAGALHVRATCAWHRGDLPLAERMAGEGLGRVGPADHAVRADLLRSLGAARYYRGNMNGAREALLSALAENRAHGRVPELAKTLNILAMVLYGLGDWHGAAGLWDEFRLICARLGDPVELAHAHNNLGFLTVRLGEPERAAALFRACIDQAREAEYQRIVPVATANLGEALALAGDYDAADRLMGEAEAWLNAADAHLDLMELHRRRAELDLLRGRPDDALARVSMITNELQPELAPLEAGHLLRISAAAHRSRGQAGEAEPLARQAVARFDEQAARFEGALAREELSRALQAMGRVVEATRLATEALDAFRYLGARRDQERTAVLVRELARQSQSGDRFARHGEVLLDVALHFGSTLDLDLLLPRVLHRLVDLLDAERGLVALFDAAGRVERAVTHNMTWAGPGHPLPLSASLQEEVMRQGRAVVVDDVRTEQQTAQWKSVAVEGLRSLVGLPLQARGGETIGLLYFDTQTHLADDPREAAELLTGISRLLGTAVENARLYRAERFRAELLADMAHHFRTPISVITANAEIVADEAARDPELAAVTTDILANGHRMMRMVDHTLEVAHVESASRTIEPETVDLVALLDKHLQGMQLLARGQGVGLQFCAGAGLPSVVTIPDRLWIVVDNLVFNALKFAREGTTVVVGVSPRPDRGPADAVTRVLADETDVFRRAAPIVPEPLAGFLEVSVQNEGKGIPADLRGRLFSRYQYAERVAKRQKSTGLGLSIVAQACRHLGGAVWLDLATDHQTRIAFTIPIAVRAPR
ncbi:protein kinase [Myxococcota bacterium]|nr:protein kinase [Myxococcota bacterium]